MTAKDVFRGIKGLMFDLDGVCYVSGKALDGAAQALVHIKERGLVCRFVTNTTTKSLKTLHAQVTAMGLPIEKEELVSAGYAGVLYLRQLRNPRCFFILQEDTLTDYAEFTATDDRPDLVVVGDYGHRWDFALINRAFRRLIDGADLVALHKGTFFQVADGLEIDTGAFVSALEYASGKTAAVIGKPQKTFFELALSGMGCAPEEVVMIGDDIHSDVGGAQGAGIAGVLVRTGKYRPELIEASPIEPDAVIDSIKDLPELL